MADRSEWCGALLACARGNEVECNLPKGHKGKHEHIMAERATCPTCGTAANTLRGCVSNKRGHFGIIHPPNMCDCEPCRDPWHESSPGAEERATPQTETETPNVPKVMPNLLQVATRIREHFPASDGTDSLDAITIAKMISSAVGRAGVAATVERPPEHDWDCTAIGEKGKYFWRCKGCGMTVSYPTPAENFPKGKCDNHLRAGEPLQPASDPTVTLEEAKAWRQVNWYDSVPQQLDEGLRAFAQSILRRKTEAK